MHINSQAGSCPCVQQPSHRYSSNSTLTALLAALMCTIVHAGHAANAPGRLACALCTLHTLHAIASASKHGDNGAQCSTCPRQKHGMRASKVQSASTVIDDFGVNQAVASAKRNLRRCQKLQVLPQVLSEMGQGTPLATAAHGHSHIACRRHSLQNVPQGYLLVKNHCITSTHELAVGCLAMHHAL